MRRPLGSEQPERYSGIPTPDPVAQHEIRQLHDAWLAAELRGDVDTVLNLCTPDVRWLVPGRPALEGRQAGRELLQAPRVKLLALRASDVRVEQSGSCPAKLAGTRLGTALLSRRR